MMNKRESELAEDVADAKRIVARLPKCSIPQARLLKRFGEDPHKVKSKEEASALIQKIMENGWKPI